LVEVIARVERLESSRGLRAEGCGGQIKIWFAVHALGGGRLALGLEAKAVIGPGANEPFDVFGDGVDVLHVLLGRVGVIHPQVADAGELAGDAEVQANGLGMADVEVAIRLGREPRVDLRILLLRHVRGNDVADEIGRRGWGGAACFGRLVGHT
jgi:hypothetical protein